MRYFGFDKPSFAFKSVGSAVGVMLSANFVTGEYALNGAAKTFADLFTFNRAGKAWLVKESGLVEYAVDVPRLDNGLLIEQVATNSQYPSSAAPLGNSVGLSFRDMTAPDGNIYRQKVDAWGSSSNRFELLTMSRSYTRQVTLSLYVQSTTPRSGLADRFRFASTNPDISINLYTVALHRVINNEYVYRVVSTFTLNSNATVASVLRLYLKDIESQGLGFWGWQAEESQNPSSYVQTTTSPVTRPADFLSSKITTGSTLTGDWDSTLNLTLVNGQLSWTGYGRIRSLEIT